jgi:hypothetical protein
MPLSYTNKDDRSSRDEDEDQESGLIPFLILLLKLFDSLLSLMGFDGVIELMTWTITLL